jgi:hypothetical protein
VATVAVQAPPAPKIQCAWMRRGTTGGGCGAGAVAQSANANAKAPANNT